MIQHNDCVADTTPYCTVILFSVAVIEQEMKKNNDITTMLTSTKRALMERHT